MIVLINRHAYPLYIHGGYSLGFSLTSNIVRASLLLSHTSTGLLCTKRLRMFHRKILQIRDLNIQGLNAKIMT